MQNEAEHTGTSPSIVIPRISKVEMWWLKVSSLSSVDIQVFNGHKKIFTTCGNIIHEGLSFTHLKQLHDKLSTAVTNDMTWLVNVLQHKHSDDLIPEWFGIMAASAKAMILMHVLQQILSLGHWLTRLHHTQTLFLKHSCT